MDLQEYIQRMDARERERIHALTTLLCDIAHAAIRGDQGKLSNLLGLFRQEEQKRVSAAVEFWLRIEPKLPSNDVAASLVVESLESYKGWLQRYIPSFIRTCELPLQSYTSCYQSEVDLSKASLPASGVTASRVTPRPRSSPQSTPTVKPRRGAADRR